MSVVLVPGVGELGDDATLAVGQDTLASIGVTDIVVIDTVELDGSESPLLKGSLLSRGVEIEVRFVFPERDDARFMTTFLFPPGISTTEIDGIVTGVVESWRWA